MTNPSKEFLVETCRKMNRLGLNRGSSGNVSVRFGEGFLITPSGIDYDRMEAADIVAMDLQGRYRGKYVPSGEWRMHRDILATYGEVGAIIHGHGPYCTALAIHGLSIPAIHYLIALAGGNDIPCIPYAPPTTQALSDLVVTGLANRRACLMAHHGVVVTGPSLDKTLNLLAEVENLATQYWHALQIGTPPVLNDEQMGRVHKIIKNHVGGKTDAKRVPAPD
uniref:L-fuculose-phosphate aldolase n=1 Tax=Candidatus Kentrum sp. FM TaxID=2126340 RepID=A0A450W2S8_9GAMM|nr:MAG: L-fuculose-phosphate aldolase [Candidatus Kentron sp. FM]VFJ56589.1 MAG: L-fuculose-phosphate aldolase [Candidatus Kentron sp. FM]VFK11315.1 MAG: L-fuculose-phosphate aldolase [Candidatus Kentron sp. FM]